ncbi:hypothetical protein J1N35_044165 [Gossypium stocksii]|uniref:Uncharacterized protein n=1 Tax=Gossypium stocksii TaxID=47602 RepID=A0A9D3U8H8_9ROSI|nr:hypothetical protein J1N35_044165 [Gossypium stocksii]
MHLEKGFTFKESNYRNFMARIHQVAEALNWELFCEKRPSVAEELVRAFYANLTSSELTEVPVHGIKRVEESEDLKEEEEDPIEIKLEVPDEEEPMELEAEPVFRTPMFRAQLPSLNL